MYSNLAAIGGVIKKGDVLPLHLMKLSWKCWSHSLCDFVVQTPFMSPFGSVGNRVPPNLLVNQAFFFRIAIRLVPHVSVTPNWWYPYYPLFIAWIPIYGWSKPYFVAFFSTIYPLIFTKPSCAKWLGLTLIPLYHTRWGPLVISWSISPAIL
jgi:hypothetical protein